MELWWYMRRRLCMIGLAVSRNDDNTNGHYINSINKVNLIVLDCTANIYLLRLGEWYSLNINSNLNLNRIYLLLNICITYLLLITLIQLENPYYYNRYLYVLEKWNHWLALDCIAIYSNWYVAVMIFSWDSPFRKVKDQYINTRWLNYFWIRDEIERIYYVTTILPHYQIIEQIFFSYFTEQKSLFWIEVRHDLNYD